MKNIFLILSVILISSCAKDTKFKGEAHLTRKKCEVKCSGWDMDLQGMIAMGEYSDACVCKKKAPPVEKVEAPLLPAQTIEEDAKPQEDESDVSIDPVGVILQKRATDEKELALSPAGMPMPHHFVMP